MEQLDPHGRALFRDQPFGHGGDLKFLTRQIQMANLVSMKALRMIIKGVVHVNQQTRFLTKSLCNVDVKPHVRRQEHIAK